MLVVVQHGDVAFLFEPALDFKALWRLDVLEVDAPESRRHRFDCSYESVGVGFVDFDIIAVEACEYFEQQSLAFHHGFGCRRPDIAQSEHSRAVGYDGDEIVFVCIFISGLFVVFDFKTRVGHAGRVGQREVVGMRCGFSCYSFDFSGFGVSVIFESKFFKCFSHNRCNCLLYFVL